MKIIITLLCVFALSGCAGFATYVSAHQAGLAAVALVGGTVATVEQVGINTITLEKDVKQPAQAGK